MPRTYAYMLGVIILLLTPIFNSYGDEKTEEYISELNPQVKENLEKLLVEFDKWPLQEAKVAAGKLIAVGKASIPVLLLKLSTGTPAAREACAYCLGELKDPYAFSHLEKACQDPVLLGRLITFFSALAKLDKEKAYTAILPFLKEESHTARYPAFSVLSGLTKPRHLNLIKPFLSYSKSGTRASAISLLENIEGDEVDDLLIKALGDIAQEVAFKAAQIAGKRDDPKIRKQLSEMYNEPDKRWRGYAILSMVFQEDRFNLRLFTEEWFPKLVEACRYDDPFVRGSAAVAIANVGYYAEDQTIVDQMDQIVIPILIETMASRVYFKDYASLRQIAYEKLTQLTGQKFEFDKNQWWRWWSDNEGKFKAPRIIKNISADQVRESKIYYYFPVKDGYRTIWITGVKIDSQREINNYTFVVSFEEIVDLLNYFKKHDLLSMPPVYGVKEPNIPFRELKLLLGHRTKTVQVYGRQAGPLMPFEDKILDVAENNNWQKYWDKSSYSKWEIWYQENYDWFSTHSDPIIRANRLKKLILTSYTSLPKEERYPAVQLFLELMEKDPSLSDTLVELAMIHIRSEVEINNISEKLIRALAETKNKSAIVPLIQFLQKHYSIQARSLMVILFQKAGRDIALNYIMNPDWRVKSAAALVLWNFPDETVILNLIRLLNDSEPEVRSAAIQSLGNMKEKGKSLGLEPVKKALHDPNQVVQKSAILALPKMTGDEGVATITEYLSSPDPGVRGVVVQALGESEGQTAIQTLVASMCGDPSPLVRESASMALSGIKSSDVSPILVRLALIKGKPESRVMALKTLGKIDCENEGERLMPLLSDEEKQVQTEAAILLARWNIKETIPILISTLQDRFHTLEARRSLERLTLVSFNDDNIEIVKQQYQDWWNVKGELSQKQWYFDALKREGYDVSELVDYLLGEKNPKILPTIVSSLRDKNWYICAATVNVLTEITGRSFGKINLFTGREETDKIISDWEKWWKEQKRE